MCRNSSLMLCSIVISLLTQYVSYHPAITELFLASVAIDDFFFHSVIQKFFAVLQHIWQLEEYRLDGHTWPDGGHVV